LGAYLDHHEELLEVPIIVQNLVTINAAVLIGPNMEVSIFGVNELKTPIHAPKLGFWDDFTP